MTLDPIKLMISIGHLSEQVGGSTSFTKDQASLGADVERVSLPCDDWISGPHLLGPHASKEEAAQALQALLPEL